MYMVIATHVRRVCLQEASERNRPTHIVELHPLAAHGTHEIKSVDKAALVGELYLFRDISSSVTTIQVILSDNLHI